MILSFLTRRIPKRAMIDDLALAALQRAAAKVGLHVTWHQLRHWGAVHALSGRVPIKVIQKRLDIQSTKPQPIGISSATIEAAGHAAKVQSELLAGWTKKHPANVAATVAVSGDKESSVDVSY